MADPLFEEAYEYLGEDGASSDEWTPGRAAFRPKGLGKTDGFRMLPISEPNDVTVAAMEELEDGRGEPFGSVDELFNDLGI